MILVESYQEACGSVNKSEKGPEKEKKGVVTEEKPTHFTDAVPAERKWGGLLQMWIL